MFERRGDSEVRCENSFVFLVFRIGKSTEVHEDADRRFRISQRRSRKRDFSFNWLVERLLSSLKKKQVP